MNILTSHKRILTIVNVALISGLIFLYHFGFLSDVSLFEFLIGVTIVFILAIYNPIIAFAIFVGVIPLEIIDISPQSVDLMIRPYQLVGILLFGAVIIRKIFGVSHTDRFMLWNVFDTFVGLFILMSFISLFFVDFEGATKQTIIIASFAFLYYLTRIFVRNKNDALALFPIIISSGVIVSLYAIFQNLLFKINGNHMEVMPGRPNATFAEADWLGLYLVFLIAIALTYLYFNVYHKHIWKFFDIALFFVMTFFSTALIITVTRSAWVGAAAVLLAYGMILFFQKKYKLFAKQAFWIFASGLLSLIVVFAFGLTTFELGNRLQSTNTGLQEITVSCQCSGQTCLPSTTVIEDVSELEQYNCRHINLEEIESEQIEGNEIVKIHRTDPNVDIRANTYNKTIKYIQNNPWVGYGWGSSGELLGSDESGTKLNASNVFLETALSIGVGGALILIAFFMTFIVVAGGVLKRSTNMKEKSLAILAILGTIAILIPNLFNAGLMLGFIWVFFGTVAIIRKM